MRGNILWGAHFHRDLARKQVNPSEWLANALVNAGTGAHEVRLAQLLLAKSDTQTLDGIAKRCKFAWFLRHAGSTIVVGGAIGVVGPILIKALDDGSFEPLALLFVGVIVIGAWLKWASAQNMRQAVIEYETEAKKDPTLLSFIQTLPS